MNFNEYQNGCVKTLKPGLTREQKIAYFSMKMAEEVGEIIGPLAKNMTHGKPIPDHHVINELGDLLYYISVMADLFEINLADVAKFNADKLYARHGEEYRENYYK
jgi:NTP pyrophosphatase (non-canonical NTP hydrolase)